jgi:hypothetical protein
LVLHFDLVLGLERKGPRVVALRDRLGKPATRIQCHAH